MAYKSKFLKNLLTTASAMAVLAGGVESAAANQRTTTVVGVANFTTGANMSAAVVNATDSVKIVTVPTSLTFGGVLNVLGVDINGNGGLVLTSTNALSKLGSVTDGVNAAATANLLNLVVTDATDLTLTGTAGITTAVANNYFGLGSVKIGTAGAGTAVLNVVTTAPVVFGVGATFDGDAAGKGTLNVYSGANLQTFNGVIGGNFALAEINVGTAATALAAGVQGEATFVGNVKTTAVTVGGAGNGGARVGGVGAATFANLAADTIAVGGVGNGGIGGIGGAGTLTITGALTNTAGNAASDVTISGGGGGGGGAVDGAGIVILTGATGINALFTFENYNNPVDSTITLDNTTFTGANTNGIDAAAAGKGIIIVTSATGKDSTVIGTIGATQSVKEIDMTNTDHNLIVDSSNAAGSIQAQTLVFAKAHPNATLKVQNTGATGGQAQTLTFTTALDQNNTVAGNIYLAQSIGTTNSVNIKGTIGDTGVNQQALQELTIEGGVASAAGSFVVLDSTGGAGQNIQTINLLGATNLAFSPSAVAANYQIGNFTALAPQQVNLSIANQNVNIKTAAGGTLSLGTSAAPLASFKFDDDHALNLGDGVSLYASALIAIGPNEGTLAFTGNSTFSAPMTPGGNTIKAINASGITATGKTATITGDIYVGTDITGPDANGSVLAFGGNVTADLAGAGAGHGFIAGGANTGTLKFVNAAPITVTGQITTAGVNQFQIIEFNGGNVNLASAVQHNTAGNIILFSSPNATQATTVIISTDNPDLSNVAISSTAALTPTLQLTYGGNNLKLTGVVGSDANHLVNIALGQNGGATNLQTTTATNLQFANVTTTVKNTNTFEFNVANGSTVNSIGTSALPLETVTFTQSGTVTGDAYAQTFNVADQKTATFNGIVGGNGTIAFANNTNATGLVLNNATLNDNVTFAKQGLNAAAGGVGDYTVTITGNGSINKNIGATGGYSRVINFSDNSTQAVTADLYSNAITAANNVTLTFSDASTQNTRNLNAGTFNANNGGVTFGGAQATPTTLALGGTNVIVEGDTKLTGYINASTVLAQGSSGLIGGNIAVNRTNALDVSNLNQMTITVDDTTNSVPLPAIGQTQTFAVVQAPNSATGTGVSKILLTPGNGTGSLSAFTASMDAKGNIIVSRTNNAPAVVNAALTAAGLSQADFANGQVIIASPSVSTLLNKITTPAKIAEFVQRGVANDASTVVSDVSARIGSNLLERTSSLAGLEGSPVESREVGDAGTSGVSAGDVPVHRFGAWLNPYMGRSMQRKEWNAAGYNANTWGASFGFDTRANDDMIVGVSASLLTTDVKYKNYMSGSKTKVNSMMFSVYGLQQINDNWFAQGAVTFGSSKVKLDQKRVVSNTGYARVHGDYTSTSFGGEGFFGYGFMVMSNVKLTPMIGARYTSISDGGYTETGNTPQLLTVSKKSTNKFEGIVGARVSGGTFNMGTMDATPEIHAFVSHDMIGKNPKVVAKLSDVATALNNKNAKPHKTVANIGASLNAEQGVMEYGIGADVNLSRKYVGYQGTLKLRVNF